MRLSKERGQSDYASKDKVRSRSDAQTTGANSQNEQTKVLEDKGRNLNLDCSTLLAVTET